MSADRLRKLRARRGECPECGGLPLDMEVAMGTSQCAAGHHFTPGADSIGKQSGMVEWLDRQVGAVEVPRTLTPASPTATNVLANIRGNWGERHPVLNMAVGRQIDGQVGNLSKMYERLTPAHRAVADQDALRRWQAARGTQVNMRTHFEDFGQALIDKGVITPDIYTSMNDGNLNRALALYQQHQRASVGPRAAAPAKPQPKPLAKPQPRVVPPGPRPAPPQQVALKKQNAYDARQLAMGLREEAEHPVGPKTRRHIVKDHLKEDPRYYTHLKELMPEPTASEKKAAMDPYELPYRVKRGALVIAACCRNTDRGPQLDSTKLGAMAYALSLVKNAVLASNNISSLRKEPHGRRGQKVLWEHLRRTPNSPLRGRPVTEDKADESGKPAVDRHVDQGRERPGGNTAAV